MLLTADTGQRRGNSPWLSLFPAVVVLMLGIVGLAPVFASRGKVGRVRWYTQVTTPSPGARPGLTPITSPWARGWVLRVGEWHWFLGLDHR